VPLQVADVSAGIMIDYDPNAYGAASCTKLPKALTSAWN